MAVEAYFTGKRESEEHYKAILVMNKVQTIAFQAKHARRLKFAGLTQSWRCLKTSFIRSSEIEKAKLEADLKVLLESFVHRSAF
ncbi:hypothetical protein Bca52824_018091 [Brassica carinata]|uniref:Uncharacterized protein n=1 Tax=Brassica carinata TaxID=52824 RepID=A0A8X7VNU4_BRACI|nr:hypothetical protein Bca52824_018091 [Brassica carinata]